MVGIVQKEDSDPLRRGVKNMMMKKFSFEKSFKEYEIEGFVQSFFNDPNVLQEIKVLCRNYNWRCDTYFLFRL
jgi:hypothetical protein